MHKYILVAVTGIFIAACGSHTRDFKAEQQAYEAKKKAKEDEKGGYFKKNQQAVEKRLGQIKALLQLADTASFTNEDSTFFYKESAINFNGLSINDYINGYSSEEKTKEKKEKPNAMVLKALRTKPATEKEEESIDYSDSRLIDRLLTCYRDSFFVDCYKISEKELESLLSVRYIFAVDEILYSKPEVQGSSQFQGGSYIALVHVFDLESKEQKPFYSFSFVGQNSETIEVNKFTPEKMKLVTDLHKNCYKAFNEVCAKHFTVKHELEGVFLF